MLAEDLNKMLQIAEKDSAYFKGYLNALNDVKKLDSVESSIAQLRLKRTHERIDILERLVLPPRVLND